MNAGQKDAWFVLGIFGPACRRFALLAVALHSLAILILYGRHVEVGNG